MTVTVEQAQATLPDLIAKLVPGQEVTITCGEKPVAKLVGQQSPPTQPRRPGNAKGMLTILKEDDEHLADFAEYMP